MSHEAFIHQLESLRERDDRATLAQLRLALREDRAIDALRMVLPFVPRMHNPVAQRRAEDDAILLAGLFALHPESGSLSLASALRIAASDSDSVELRFRALLTSSREDLPTHLRAAVTLVRSKGFGINWRDLYNTLRNWDHELDFVRRAWASDFWSVDDITPESEPATTTHETPVTQGQ